MLAFCLFSFVQIVTESLPISSSGHLKLVCASIPTLKSFCVETCEFFAHGPTALIIALFFKNYWARIVCRPFYYVRTIKYFLTRGLCAELPVLFCYFFLARYVNSIPLWIGFLVTLCALFSLYYLNNYKNNFYVTNYYVRISYVQAFVIGLAQAIAFMQVGISRLGLTYVTARWFGISPQRAFLFSFTIEWPLIFVAFLKSIKNITCLGLLEYNFFENLSCLLLCLIVSTFCAYYVLAFVYRLVCSNTLYKIGFYMIIPVLCALFM